MYLVSTLFLIIVIDLSLYVKEYRIKQESLATEDPPYNEPISKHSIPLLAVNLST